jgi:hypothetical protein
LDTTTLFWIGPFILIAITFLEQIFFGTTEAPINASEHRRGSFSLPFKDLFLFYTAFSSTLSPTYFTMIGLNLI